MKKAIGLTLLITLLITASSFIEDSKSVVCGTWKATVFAKSSSRRMGVDSLQIKKNGRFILKRYSTENLPGIYMGRWRIHNDSLLLVADAGGVLLFDEKGQPVADKLEKKEEIAKLSIVIHSRQEANLLRDNYSFSRINP